MKRIINHAVNKDPVITKKIILTLETMIDKEDVDIINNEFGHSDPFQSGTFG